MIQECKNAIAKQLYMHFCIVSVKRLSRYDFHQSDPENMYYAALARGVKHFKEAEEGRENMCEAVEEYAKEYAKKYAAREKIVSVQNLMENMKLTLEQALNALGIQGDEREVITKELQK